MLPNGYFSNQNEEKMAEKEIELGEVTRVSVSVSYLYNPHIL